MKTNRSNSTNVLKQNSSSSHCRIKFLKSCGQLRAKNYKRVYKGSKATGKRSKGVKNNDDILQEIISIN